MDSAKSPLAVTPQAALDLLDLTLPTPEENLALDEALLNEAEEQAGRGEPIREILRFWESAKPFVVLGSTGRLSEEVHVENCRREGIPVLRRASGGGTVLNGPGCLCYALILGLDNRPELHDIHASYRTILSQMARRLGLEGLDHRGISDIALKGRKVSGNAQRRKSRVLLHHGTILYAADPEQMERVLKNPPRQPDYRAGRAHAAFTANLPLPAEEIKRRLSRCWNARTPARPPRLPDLTALIEEKYANRQWIERF
jgi:lipoate-protein ligase A